MSLTRGFEQEFTFSNLKKKYSLLHRLSCRTTLFAATMEARFPCSCWMEFSNEPISFLENESFLVDHNFCCCANKSFCEPSSLSPLSLLLSQKRKLHKMSN